MGPDRPEQYGGAGMSNVALAIVLERELGLEPRLCARLEGLLVPLAAEVVDVLGGFGHLLFFVKARASLRERAARRRGHFCDVSQRYVPAISNDRLLSAAASCAASCRLICLLKSL